MHALEEPLNERHKASSVVQAQSSRASGDVFVGLKESLNESVLRKLAFEDGPGQDGIRRCFLCWYLQKVFGCLDLRAVEGFSVIVGCEPGEHTTMRTQNRRVERTIRVISVY